MNGWILFGCILLAFWLIGMIRAGVEIEYNTGVRVAVKLLGMTFRITPKEKKPPKLSDFTPRKYRKRLAKDEKLRRKQEEKKAKKQAEKARKKAERQGHITSPDGKQKKRKEPAEIMELVLVGLDALKGLLRSFGKHFEIEAVRLKIAVASGDAASTAILYGIVVQFVTYLCHALGAITNFKVKKPEEIAVTADYLSDKLTVDLHFVFRLRVWHLFAMLFAAGIGAVKRMLKTKINGNELPLATKNADTKSTDSPAG